MRYKTYSYRYGEEIMNAKLSLKREIEEVVNQSKTKMETRSAEKLNEEFKDLLKKKRWEHQVKVADELGLTIDFQKERVGVEVQFGNVARTYADLFKLQIMSYSGLNKIDVGVIILPTQKYANKMTSAVANFEKLIRELPYFKSALQVPLWIIGLEE